MSNNKEIKLVPPETVGLSSRRLERLDELVNQLIDSGDLPGVLTMVIRYGQVAHFNSQGLMDMELNKPLAKDSLFRMYSMTKPVTATAIMMLYEEGKLMLDDPVVKYIPSFANQEVITHQWPEGKSRYSPRGRVYTTPVERDMTIRDLLTHTAGLASPRLTPIIYIKELTDAIGGSLFLPPENGKACPQHSIREGVEKLGRIPLSFQPGSDWQYGHEFDVLGVLVEIISGKTLEEFFKQKIFEPLGMDDTSFTLTDEKLKRLTTEYTWDESWKLKVYEKPQNAIKLKEAKDTFSGLGDFGGILSTITDYSRFTRMLLNRGELDGVRLLSPKTLELMSANHTHDLFVHLRGYGWGYGFSLGLMNDPTRSLCISSAGLYGWSGASCTYFFIDPTEEMIGLAFSQVLGYGYKPGFRFHQQFEKAIYQAVIND
jgi:CubicO group peptidase (beta-lactamase class C family)